VQLISRFEIFIFSSRDDILDFDAKVGEDTSGQKDSEYELGTAVDMLGLEDEDSRARQATQGAYMSYLLLRHLRLRDLQRTVSSDVLKHAPVF
jgi:hypothetical protein